MGVYTHWHWGHVRVILGLYRDNGKENGSYYLGFRAWGSGLRALGFGLWVYKGLGLSEMASAVV